MIDIDSAIEESKNKKNISDGGSQCFDFGDVVLVRYSCPLKYLKEGEHTRDKEEQIMEAINKKADNGVNTPHHLAMKRVIEDERETCYVLQEKCQGVNCASQYEYGASIEKVLTGLTFVSNIPFEHYIKLISDGCMLYEMGYEAKNKNLFYDTKTGFWFIDFLDNNQDDLFNPNDINKVFEALKNRIPKPIQIASTTSYDQMLTEKELAKKNMLEYAIKAKTLLAIRTCFPNFSKYEKFFLSKESSEYKAYLMQTGITNDDLNILNEKDYETFNELYENVIHDLIGKVINHNVTFWDIQANLIRNNLGHFNLDKAWTLHKDNTIKRENYEDDYDWERDARHSLEEIVLNDLTERLKKLPPSDGITAFLKDKKSKEDFSALEAIIAGTKKDEKTSKTK